MPAEAKMRLIGEVDMKKQINIKRDALSFIITMAVIQNDELEGD